MSEIMREASIKILNEAHDEIGKAMNAIEDDNPNYALDILGPIYSKLATFIVAAETEEERMNAICVTKDGTSFIGDDEAYFGNAPGLVEELKAMRSLRLGGPPCECHKHVDRGHLLLRQNSVDSMCVI